MDDLDSLHGSKIIILIQLYAFILERSYYTSPTMFIVVDAISFSVAYTSVQFTLMVPFTLIFIGLITNLDNRGDLHRGETLETLNKVEFTTTVCAC